MRHKSNRGKISHNRNKQNQDSTNTSHQKQIQIQKHHFYFPKLFHKNVNQNENKNNLKHFNHRNLNFYHTTKMVVIRIFNLKLKSVTSIINISLNTNTQNLNPVLQTSQNKILYLRKTYTIVGDSKLFTKPKTQKLPNTAINQQTKILVTNLFFT